MKHITSITKIDSFPAQASLLEMQQKAAIFASFAAALGTFAAAIGALFDLAAED